MASNISKKHSRLIPPSQRDGSFLFSVLLLAVPLSLWGYWYLHLRPWTCTSRSSSVLPTPIRRIAEIDQIRTCRARDQLVDPPGSEREVVAFVEVSVASLEAMFKECLRPIDDKLFQKQVEQTIRLATQDIRSLADPLIPVSECPSDDFELAIPFVADDGREYVAIWFLER